MNYPESKIPEFQCHKKVKAFKISEVGRTTLKDCTGSYSVIVTKEYLRKHKPEIGGYYVLYEDGYESYSPAKAFEDGYVLEGDESAYPWRDENKQGEVTERCHDCGKACSDIGMESRISDELLKDINLSEELLCFPCLDQRLKKVGAGRSQEPVWTCGMEPLGSSPEEPE